MRDACESVVVVGVLSELSVGERAYRWMEWVPLEQAPVLAVGHLLHTSIIGKAAIYSHG
jgi:hypothetical protein